MFFSVLTSVLAEEIKITSKKQLPVDKKVIDIVINDGKQFLLTLDKEAIELTPEGSLSLEKSVTLQGFSDLKIEKNSINKNKIDIDRYTYLTKGDGVYYGCLFDWSMSSKIVKIDPKTGEEKFFCWLKGIPSGMFYKEGKLWYLSNRNTPGSESIIRAYDEETGKIVVFGPHVPVLDAKGLYLSDDGTISTYENCTNSLIEFEIEEEK
jgi:hypothetical protein